VCCGPCDTRDPGRARQRARPLDSGGGPSYTACRLATASPRLHLRLCRVKVKQRALCTIDAVHPTVHAVLREPKSEASGLRWWIVVMGCIDALAHRSARRRAGAACAVSTARQSAARREVALARSGEGGIYIRVT